MDSRMVLICRAGDQLSFERLATDLGQVGGLFLCYGIPTFQNVEADATELVDVGVKDLGEEANLGRRHRVVFGEEKLELEDAACRVYG